jgi:hypothetical protein
MIPPAAHAARLPKRSSRADAQTMAEAKETVATVSARD